MPLTNPIRPAIIFIACLLISAMVQMRTTEHTPAFYWKNALSMSRNGDYTGAIRACSEFVKLRPCSDGYEYRAWLWGMLGEQKNAIQDYTSAISLSPSSESYFRRGIDRDSIGDRLGAIADYSKSISLKPEIAVYINRGVTKSELGDVHGAIADFEEVIRLDSKNCWGYRDRGYERWRLGDWLSALADYDIAIGLSPSNEFFLCDRARILIEHGRIAEAQRDITKALQIHANLATALEMKSQLIRRQLWLPLS